MKIYIAHSRECDYRNELYLPIRNCQDLDQAEIILPHETDGSSGNTREFYKDLDLMIAEVSYPATGQGIELGWAYDDGTPVVCIAKNDAKVSGSILAVTDQIYRYNNSEELVKIIQQTIFEHR